MFQLSKNKRIERVTNCDRFRPLKHSTSYPYAFTWLGVAMLSSVISSDRAILANIQIMRTFSKMKEIISHHKNLQKKMDELEKTYDEKFSVVFKAIKVLLEKAKKNDDPPRFTP